MRTCPRLPVTRLAAVAAFASDARPPPPPPVLHPAQTMDALDALFARRQLRRSGGDVVTSTADDASPAAAAAACGVDATAAEDAGRPAPTLPAVTLTWAQSLDGCLAAARGTPTRLSGDDSMVMTHCVSGCLSAGGRACRMAIAHCVSGWLSADVDVCHPPPPPPPPACSCPVRVIAAAGDARRHHDWSGHRAGGRPAAERAAPSDGSGICSRLGGAVGRCLVHRCRADAICWAAAAGRQWR
jgi:hypothetical protein